MSYAMPLQIRLEVDSMRQQILHAFAQRQGETLQILQAQLDTVLTEQNIAAVVQAEALNILRQELHQEIKQSIWRAVANPEVRERLDTLTAQAFLAVLEAKE